MATGVNDIEINRLKVDLLNCVEQVNILSGRIDTCRNSVRDNMSGTGKSEILAKFNSIMEQLPMINANLNTYIISLGRVMQAYSRMDESVASDITRNIGKLGS